MRFSPCAIAALCLLLPLSAPAHAAETKSLRIVFLGDSITDGNTYPALVRQALAEAGKPVPVCINAAGIGGDTAKGMRKRLERDVLIHHPNLVTLSAGINDVLHRVKPADYEADVAAIAERLHREKIPLVILTTSILGQLRAAETDDRLADFNAALRRVAKKYECKIAEVNRLHTTARKEKQTLLDADDVHPNFQGHRLMARAVLDALGHENVPVPKEQKPEMMPGVIHDWRFRTVGPKEKPLDDRTAAAQKPDATWKPYRLPEKDKLKGWWNDLERQRGFAQQLAKVLGPAPRYVGVATLEAKQAGKAYFNTGAELRGVWLNGERIYRATDEWKGWHAGRERLPVQLKAGRNVIVIETGGSFFLSCTNENDW